MIYTVLCRMLTETCAEHSSGGGDRVCEVLSQCCTLYHLYEEMKALQSQPLQAQRLTLWSILHMQVN